MENEGLLLEVVPSVAAYGRGLMRDAQIPLVEVQVFRREGEYWTVAYNGAVCRLRDTKGMQLLADLLRCPGQRVPARQLLGASCAASPNAVTAMTGPAAMQQAVPPDWAAAERARVNVTRAIRGALQKIGAHHPTLCAHLSSTIRTGSACVYLPDPGRPVRWETSTVLTAFAVNGWDEV